MPQASFIVPTLNEEKYLQACLSSIVNQRTCVDYELIVVDGGSKDRTVAIAERYADKVICLGRRGIWLGRNEGASRARGRLLLFIDADTSVPANYLEVAHGVMQDEQVSALSHAFRFDKGGRLMGMVQDVVNNYLLAKSLAGIGEILGFNAVIGRSTFTKVGGFPEAPLDDAAIAKKLRKKGKLVYLLEPKVTTSSRRLERAGMIMTIVYYASLGLVTDIPSTPVKKLMPFRDYVPFR